MTDTALNESVARKLGWEEASTFPSVPKNAKTLELCGWQRPNAEEGVDWLSSPPDYCHSIEAAWEIVEWLVSHGRKCSLHNINKNWSFEISSYGNVENDSESHLNELPSKAICLAFEKLEDK